MHFRTFSTWERYQSAVFLLRNEQETVVVWTQYELLISFKRKSISHHGIYVIGGICYAGSAAIICSFTPAALVSLPECASPIDISVGQGVKMVGTEGRIFKDIPYEAVSHTDRRWYFDIPFPLPVLRRRMWGYWAFYWGIVVMPAMRSSHPAVLSRGGLPYECPRTQYHGKSNINVPLLAPRRPCFVLNTALDTSFTLYNSWFCKQ